MQDEVSSEYREASPSRVRKKFQALFVILSEAKNLSFFSATETAERFFASLRMTKKHFFRSLLESTGVRPSPDRRASTNGKRYGITPTLFLLPGRAGLLAHQQALFEETALHRIAAEAERRGKMPASNVGAAALQLRFAKRRVIERIV